MIWLGVARSWGPMTKGFCSACNKFKEPCGNASAGPNPRCFQCIKNGIKVGHYKMQKKSDPPTYDERDNPKHPNSRSSTYDRYRMVVYSEFGLNQSEIANIVGVDRRTVSRVHETFVKTDNVKDRPRTGRKRKLSDAQITAIVEYAKRTKFTTPRDIKFHLDLDSVSFKSIDRVLIEHGLFGRVARVLHPNFDPKKRLSWCQGKRYELSYCKLISFQLILYNYIYIQAM